MLSVRRFFKVGTAQPAAVGVCAVYSTGEVWVEYNNEDMIIFALLLVCILLGGLAIVWIFG